MNYTQVKRLQIRLEQKLTYEKGALVSSKKTDANGKIAGVELPLGGNITFKNQKQTIHWYSMMQRSMYQSIMKDKQFQKVSRSANVLTE